MRNICATVAHTVEERPSLNSKTVHPVRINSHTEKTPTPAHNPFPSTLSFEAGTVERVQVLLGNSFFFFQYLYLQTWRRLVIRRPPYSNEGRFHPSHPFSLSVRIALLSRPTPLWGFFLQGRLFRLTGASWRAHRFFVFIFTEWIRHSLFYFSRDVQYKTSGVQSQMYSSRL